jgi:methylated-DNA-[protein]-cysteine S-methyltransferase
MPAPSPFTSQVHAVVKAIPKGSVMTYKQVAEKAGNGKAARAVANLMAKNFNPEIPCHRVIRSDGGLGGYNRGGEAKKRAILQSEGVVLTKL